MSGNARSRWLRLALLGALIVALVVAGKYSGVTANLTLERVRVMIVSGGPWGVALYVVLFSLGELVHVPGLVFVAAGVLAYGRLGGGVLGWLSSIIAVSVTFAVARAVGGRPLAEVESPRMRRLLAGLERRPVLTVFLLRTVFVLSPPLSYALALSGMKFRDYLLGSAAGLVAPVAAAVFFFDWVLRHFG